ncbi:MAG: hypothetical protein U9P14_03765 [Gemmatimonadota bacterium]|nr:hypothetical protein [Gemmatimonadota bacterium]
MSARKIIKAGSPEASDIKVGNVELGGMRFGSKVLKDAKIEDQPLEMNKASSTDGQGGGATEEAAPSTGKEVQLESSLNEDGDLVGLRITCKCGEVIDLEFTRD